MIKDDIISYFYNEFNKDRKRVISEINNINFNLKIYIL